MTSFRLIVARTRRRFEPSTIGKTHAGDQRVFAARDAGPIVPPVTRRQAARKPRALINGNLDKIRSPDTQTYHIGGRAQNLILRREINPNIGRDRFPVRIGLLSEKRFYGTGTAGDRTLGGRGRLFTHGG